MGIITRLIPHYSQPQGLDRPNPQYRTLRSLIHPLPNGKVVDLVNTSRAMAYGANILSGIHKKGRYVGNETDGVSEIQATGACQYQTFSRIAIIRRNYDPAKTGTISDSRTSSAANGAQWGISGGELLLNVASTVQIGATSGAGITTGVEYVVGVSYDGTNVKFFIDGRLAGSASNAQTFTIDAAATLFSRGGAASPNEDLNGAIGLHADFEGALPESVMKSLTANPWQLYAPRKRQIYVNVAAGSGSVAASAGVAAASGVGASVATTVGASNGIGAVSGVGASSVTATGSSAGVGAASGVGLGATSSVGSSTGTGTASGTGASTVNAVGSSSGIATVSGIAPVEAGTGVGSSSGTATVSGVGASIVAAVGASSGGASVSGVSGNGAIVTPEEISYAPQRKTRAPNFAPRKEPAKPEAKKKTKAKPAKQEPRNRLRMANELIMPDTMLDLMQKRREQQAIERQHLYNIRARAALLAA